MRYKNVWLIPLIGLLVPLLLNGCEDSEGCGCTPDQIDPPMSDLSVSWDQGFMSANLMPIVPPDPVTCRVWLILENMNKQEEFSKLEIPTADVILAKTDSTLGTIPLETDWDGILAPGEKDTVQFYKLPGTEPIFTPPCGDYVLFDFIILNADGAAKEFASDSVIVQCVY